ncbi:unnamed protein product [Musa hybrid cultivar]
MKNTSGAIPCELCQCILWTSCLCQTLHTPHRRLVDSSSASAALLQLPPLPGSASS